MTVTLAGGGVTVTLPLAGDTARTQGYARWRVENRPRREPLTVYEGQDGLTLTIPCLLDRAPNGSVEPEITRLERLATPKKAGEEPPIVTVTGPVPHTQDRWVIQDIQWGDHMINKQGRRSRQAVTVVLLRYVRPDQIKGRILKPKAAARTYRVRKGDTLTKIAVAVYKNATLWRQIANANKIKNRNAALAVGRVLKIPAVSNKQKTATKPAKPKK